MFLLIKSPPRQVAQLALKNSCQSVAYTYTDPSVFYEYALDSSKEVKKAGLKNIIVSAGYFNQKPLTELCRFIDGANIDLKAYSDKFYREVCSATLKPVLDSLVTIKSLNVHLEITNLLLPTLNDSDIDIKNLCVWIKENLGKEIPPSFFKILSSI